MSPEAAIAAIAVEMIGALIQGTIGFGINLIVAPLLVLIDPRFAPGPVVLASMIGSFFVTWRERGTLDRSTLGWALAGRLPGTAIGILILTVTVGGKLRPIVGLMVLVAVLITVPRRRIKRNSPSLFGVGIASGIMGTIAGLGGTPFGLVCQDLPGAVARPTVAAFVTVGAAVSAIALGSAGRIGSEGLILTALLLPGVAAGFMLSSKILGSINQRAFRVAVLVIATAGGLAAVLKGPW